MDPSFELINDLGAPNPSLRIVQADALGIRPTHASPRLLHHASWQARAWPFHISVL
jgi:hypothetical protein